MVVRSSKRMKYYRQGYWTAVNIAYPVITYQTSLCKNVFFSDATVING
jgi:hypothetical protein